MIYSYPRNFAKEERYELRYVSRKDGEVKNCYPRSKEGKEEQLRLCKEHGIKVIHCKKLYPFSTEKNQHNFMLIANICANTMRDMDNGDIEYNEAEYDRLYDLKDKADKYFGYPLPVAWVTWEEHQEMKQLSFLASEHRANVCIEHGRLDLIKYC